MVRCRCGALCRRLVLVLLWAALVERGARSEGLAVLGVSSTDAPPSRGRAGGADVTRHLGAASGGLSSFHRGTRARRMRASPASPAAQCASAGASLIWDEATWLKRRKSVNALLVLMVWLLMNHHSLFVQPP